MRFAVVVALVFQSDRNDEEFDLWDILTSVESGGPREAMEAAISAFRTSRAWEVLGYGCPPIVVAIRSVHTPEPVGDFGSGRLPIFVGSVGLRELDLLRAYETIQVPYAFIDIDD